MEIKLSIYFRHLIQSGRYFNNNLEILKSNPNINYHEVNQKLSKLKKESEKFIIDAITTKKDNNCKDYSIHKKQETYKIIYIHQEVKRKTKHFEITEQKNDGKTKIPTSIFKFSKNTSFYCIIKILIDKSWFYYTSDTKFIDVDNYHGEELYKLYKDDYIPYFPVNGIKKVIIEFVKEQQRNVKAL